MKWRIIAGVALFIVLAWPPQGDRSLAMKVVNWAVDPRHQLPELPPPLPVGQEDDPELVAAHDLQTLAYQERYAKGGWTRVRLRLKVAGDPFDPVTERQVLIFFGVAAALAAWQLAVLKR